MLSPATPYSLLKMHWSPEHAAPLSQWPEQHLDVTSTTSPQSAHKQDPYSTAARRSYAPAGYPWASDDISALTASSLLKRYAEKYSGLELQYDRPATGAYSESGSFLKTESEPWSLSQGMDCYPGLEALTVSKVGSPSVGIPTTGSVTLVSSNLASDPGYSSAASCNAPSSQEYPPAYNSTYLSPGYCPQPNAALPPAPLHTLQPSPTLVPSYSTPVYNCPPGCYPQAGLTSGYNHPSASYLPSGISAPTPLAPRPTMVGGSYSYPCHNLGGSSDAGVSLKRKAFEMTEEVQEEVEAEGSRYKKYGNRPGSSHSKGSSSGQANGYDVSGPATDQQGYKPGKPLISPPYNRAGDYSPPSSLAGESVTGEHSFSQQQRMSVKIPTSHIRAEDPTGGH